MVLSPCLAVWETENSGFLRDFCCCSQAKMSSAMKLPEAMGSSASLLPYLVSVLEVPCHEEYAFILCFMYSQLDTSSSLVRITTLVLSSASGMAWKVLQADSFSDNPKLGKNHGT